MNNEMECQHDMGHIDEELGVEFCLMADHYRVLGTDEAKPENWINFINRKTIKNICL